MNITPKRQIILDTLKKKHTTISARDLAMLLPEIDQATIYRNLDFFVKHSLVNKYVFDGSESVYEFAEPNHHHAVCNNCDKVIHIHAPDKKMLELLGVKDFEVQSLQVTVRGKCSK